MGRTSGGVATTGGGGGGTGGIAIAGTPDDGFAPVGDGTGQATWADVVEQVELNAMVDPPIGTAGLLRIGVGGNQAAAGAHTHAKQRFLESPDVAAASLALGDLWTFDGVNVVNAKLINGSVWLPTGPIGFALLFDTLPDAVVGTAYSQTLTKSGATGAVTWSATALPAGLSLAASTGILSGTPTGSASRTVVMVMGVDAIGNKARSIIAFNVVASGSALAWGTVSVPSGTLGVAYSYQLTATGGTAGYTFTVQAGTLPAGLTLSSAGLLSGTPTQYGRQVTLRVTDSAGSPAHVDLVFAIVISGYGSAALAFVMPSLADMIEGVDYSAELRAGATGGTPFVGAETAGHDAAAHVHYSSNSLPNKRVNVDANGVTTGSAGRVYTALGLPPAAVILASASVNPATDTVTSVAHTLHDGDQIKFQSIGALSGVDTATTYYLVSTAADTFALSLSLAGAPVNIGGTTSTVSMRTIDVQVTVQITITDLTGATAAGSTVIHIKPPVTSGVDIAQYVGITTYTQGGGAVDPVANTAGILAACATALAAGKSLQCSLGSIAAPATILLGSVRCGDTYISTAFNNFDCANVIFKFADNQPVTLTRNTVAVNVATGVMTYNGHNLINGNGIIFTSLSSVGGLTLNQVYFVVNRTANDFKVSATSGGAPVTLSGTNGNVNAIGGAAHAGAGATMFYIDTPSTNATFKMIIDGNAANQSQGVPGVNDGGFYSHALSLYKSRAAVFGLTTRNVRGVTGSSHGNTVFGAVSCDPATDKITSAGHGLVNGNTLRFRNVGTLTAINTTTIYYVVAATTNDFKVSTTLGGGAVNITGTLGNVSIQCYNGALEVFDVQNRWGAGGDSGTIICEMWDGQGHENAFNLPGTVTTVASTDYVNCVDHGLTIGQLVRFSNKGALGAEVTVGNDYYVNRVIDDDNFTITATRTALYGTPINLSANATVVMNALAGAASSLNLNGTTGNSSSGVVYHYIGLGVAGQSSPRSSVLIQSSAKRHGMGAYCGGNITVMAGSFGRGCDTAFNIEAGNPAGSANPNAMPTGDVIFGDGSATLGQIKSCRCSKGLVTNGNNTAPNPQIKSIVAWGLRSAYDTYSMYPTGSAIAPSTVVIHHLRSTSAGTNVLHYASTGTNLSQEQAATTLDDCLAHLPPAVVVSPNYGATTGTIGSY